MKDWTVNYRLDSDNKSIITWVLRVCKELGETGGEYTEEEANRIVKLLHQQKVPEMKEVNEWGSKTCSGWDAFVKENDIKIKQLLNETQV